MEGNAPHACLRTADIQVLIFRLLSRRDCAQLARTCTSFYDQAMNVVWAEVTSIVSLVMCMPADAITESQQPSKTRTETQALDSGHIDIPGPIIIDFTREPSPADWQACRKHAHRIRKFVHAKRCYYGDKDLSIFRLRRELSPAAAELVSRYICERAAEPGSTRFLPKVKDLLVRAGHDAYFSKHLPFTCGDSLRSLKLTLGRPASLLASLLGLSPPDSRVHTDLSNLLPSMRSSWPYLCSIQLIDESNSKPSRAESYLEAICAWIRDLPQLQSFKTDITFHPSLVLALSDLPLLRTMELRGHSEAIPDTTFGLSSSPGRLRFPSLTDLSLTTYTPYSPIPLLQSLHASHTLTKVKLEFVYAHDAPESATQAPKAIEAISRIPSLESIDIYFGSSESRPIVEDLPLIPILSRPLLSPLFQLRRLRLLRLSGLADIFITDEDLGDAAGAWPELEVFELQTLRLGSPFMVEHAPFTSLLGVQELYNQCPNLRQVVMAVNDHLPTTDGKLDLPEARSRDIAVDELKLVFCPLHDPLEELEEGSEDYMWIVIRLLFPNLKRLISRHPCEDDNWSDENDTHWGKEMQANWEAFRDLGVVRLKALLDSRWEEFSAEA